MRNRKRNNIVIGTLCAVLVLMGVGYAILNTTLNIGGTANITGDFDIHFTRIQRSSSTITDSTLLSTMDNGTGITENTSNHEGTFTAILQKPTDYVIYTVSVANTGSIDGYLTFSFDDTNDNFDYYKDFYSVEFIRDDVDPDISTDILQPNSTFTDTEVLENTTGTRTYKIKVMFKESATSFPDPTHEINNQAVGNFECELSLTYSQASPSQNNNSGNNNSSNNNSLDWYVLDMGNSEGLAIALDNSKHIQHFMVDGEDASGFEGFQFVSYDSVNIVNNYTGMTLTEGDFVVVDQGNLLYLLRNNTIYIMMEMKQGATVFQATLTPNYTPPTSNNLTWYANQNRSVAFALNNNLELEHVILDGEDIIEEFAGSSFEAYSSSMDNLDNSIGQLQSTDYVWINTEEDAGEQVLFQYVFAILRNDTIYFQMEPGDPEEPIVELDLQSNASLSDFIS